MTLTLNQKIEMTETLWDSIYHEAQQLPITEEQAQLLEQRLAAYGADPQAGQSWDEVVTSIKKQK
jgi:putative addiction module component (TIGR02574 family)